MTVFCQSGYHFSLKMTKVGPMTDKQRKELLRAQQGEMDAVPMYNALADVAKTVTITKKSLIFSDFLWSIGLHN